MSSESLEMMPAEPDTEDGGSANALAELARNIHVSAEIDGEEAVFRVIVQALPAALLGRRIRLTLEKRTVMAIDLPPKPIGKERSFGPVRMPLSLIRRMKDYALTVRLENEPEVEAIPGGLKGELLEAMHLDSPERFFEKVQLHGSRFKDPQLLVIGARCAFARFDTFQIRAAALTIQAHRILEKDYAKLTPEDWDVIDELLELIPPVVDAGQQLVDANDPPPWDLVRWTVSLATVGGNLSLFRDDVERAAHLFGFAARNVRHVSISHVSALNVINGCFFSGVLEAMLGRSEEASATLLEGVVRFKDAVIHQKLTANVWVIGDLINVARGSRQCFIARVALGLWENDPKGLMEDGLFPTLESLASPVRKISQAGFCPNFTAYFNTIGRAPAN